MKKKILVVDDEKLILDVISQILDKLLDNFSYELITAEGGQKGIDIIRGNESLDLVITDLIMPDVTGADIYKAVQEYNEGKDKKLPIFFITGTLWELEETYDLKGVDYLVKPFLGENLVGKIKEYLG